MENIKDILEQFLEPNQKRTKFEAAVDYVVHGLHDKGYSYQDLAYRWNWSKGMVHHFIKEIGTAPVKEPKHEPVLEKEEKKKKTTVKLSGKSDKLVNLNQCPEELEPKYFWIAKAYHTLFLNPKAHGETRTLMEASAEKWTEEVRKLIELDKVTIDQLLAIKVYWDAVVAGEKGLDDWWLKTISSMAAFRKKSRDGMYYWDMIVAKIKPWTEDPKNANLLYNKILKFKKYVGIV